MAQLSEKQHNWKERLRMIERDKLPFDKFNLLTKMRMIINKFDRIVKEQQENIIKANDFNNNQNDFKVLYIWFKQNYRDVDDKLFMLSSLCA